MKKFLIVGNWKMNLNVHEASILVKRLDDHIKIQRNVEIVLAPNLLVLQPISREIDKRKFKLAAQNAYYIDEGAYTGEVSFTMLRHLVDYALIGHSERRIYFNESLEVIRDKVAAAIRNDIRPILCVGETSQEKDDNETKRVLHDQLTTALSDLTAEEIDRVIIAYEPVWAISTFGGKRPALPEEIKTAIDWIRSILSDLYGHSVAREQTVIYGASVEPEFVGEILSLEGVDGLLPGAASLNYAKFTKIVEAAAKVSR
ncbi:MAG TPA: triose-phosphate isomerase [Candidatus Saccharimonadales bacterium]|nr:triose-phosphate isomerase [Candidatus Saccharimonadales bacterium]